MAFVRIKSDNREATTRTASSSIVVTLLPVLIIFSNGLCACASNSNNSEKNEKPAATSVEKSKKKIYSDIPTAYPALYQYSSDSCWDNVYNESRVISCDIAGNYVGQQVTVEGVPSSVIYASNTRGTPIFFNFGGGPPGGFAAVLWNENMGTFDYSTLDNYIRWSSSGEPMSKFRISGIVEMYGGRPQITLYDGSQVASYVNGEWANFLSFETVNALTDRLYR